MDELIKAILKAITDNVTLTGTLEMGQLPPDDGISAEIAPSSNLTTYQNKGKLDKVSLLFLRKSPSQVLCIQELEKIGEYLSRLTTYPQPENDMEWANSLVSTPPTYVDTEDNGSFIYSMIVDNLISW